MSAGSEYTCALRSNGTLWCWGANWDGWLGQGNWNDTNTPLQVGTTTTWATVSTGGYHTCATRTDGTLWCWGANWSHQAGQPGTTGDQTTPTQVGTNNTWATVSAGEQHTCARRTDDTIWCFGLNAHGQTGQGDTTPRAGLTQVPGGTGKALSVGYAANHIMIIS
ncbi:RCC1 domain-containing protein [Actinoplanes sp. CA-030573]|uniref:RCC1 domain-containing protein n=1 Tax=Actinoplanes sp. CA-030573 TaxID=3239898 RepID=UPI003D939790